MGLLRIKCHGCGQTWEAYRHNRKMGAARTCPHCGERIDGKTWEEFVLPAFDAMQNANVELMNDHVNFHKPIFQLEYWEDMLFPNADEVEATEALEARLDALEERINMIADAFLMECRLDGKGGTKNV